MDISMGHVRTPYIPFFFFFFFFLLYIMREKLDMAEIEHSTDMKLLILTKFKTKYDEKLFLMKIVIVLS